jgi:hypothetical protein
MGIERGIPCRGSFLPKQFPGIAEIAVAGQALTLEQPAAPAGRVGGRYAAAVEIVLVS